MKTNKNLSCPDEVKIIILETAPFKRAKDAVNYTKDHGIVGTMSNDDSNGKGTISISLHSISKMLSGSAVNKSVTPALHYASLVRLRDIIRESFIAEIHPDFLKGTDLKRNKSNGTNPFVSIVVLYGCVSMADIQYRAKTTLKLYNDPHAIEQLPTKAYSYEINNIEILKGNCRTSARPSDKTSMIDTNILLQGVRDVNGELLIGK